MTDERMQAGIEALRSGNKREARRLFNEIVHEQADNAAAWWYLSAVTDEPTQKVYCLRQVLRLEPGHTAAVELLHEFEPRIGGATPPRGSERPILDASERTGKQVVIDDPAQDIDQPPPANKSRYKWIAPVIALLVLVVGTVWLGSAIRSGYALDQMNLQTPSPLPTLIPFQFGVPECLPSNDERAVLVFVNETGLTLDLLRGLEGRESELMVIKADAQELIETSGGVSVRYAVRTDDATYAISGAVIEIPAASTCRVTIDK